MCWCTATRQEADLPLPALQWSYTGWVTAIVAALPNKAVVGIIYIVGACLWSVETLLSIYVLKVVRSSGSSRLNCRAFDGLEITFE